MRKVRIGITINISAATESFFTNGVKQHAINLRDLLLECSNVSEVYFINLGSQQDLSNSPWKEYSKNILPINQIVEKLDLIITLMSGFPDSIASQLKSRGIKIVKQAIGTEYHMFTEYMLFQDKTDSGFDQRSPHQAVWILPHHYEANKDYFEVMCQAPAYQSPFVWSPKFLEQEINKIPSYQATNGVYQSTSDVKRISVIEPNINTVKTCLTPILAGEKLFQQYPDNFKKMSIFCSQSISKKKDFIKFAQNLDIYRNKKLFFEGRYHILYTLSNHTDIVLCHQRDLALNYIYFDVAWLGYPLVHNSHMLKELGYYYEGYDASQAAGKIKQVIDQFEVNKDIYLKQSREYISKFLPQDPNNVRLYEDLVETVMK